MQRGIVKQKEQQACIERDVVCISQAVRASSKKLVKLVVPALIGPTASRMRQYLGSLFGGHSSASGRTRLRSTPVLHNVGALESVALMTSSTTRAVSGWHNSFELLALQQGTPAVSFKKARHSMRLEFDAVEMRSSSVSL